MFYQFLSFWKIAESVRQRRERRAMESKNAGLPAERFSAERFPILLTDLILDDWTKDSFIPYLGKKFNNVVDQFEKAHRNAIAHLDLQDPVVASLDSDNLDDERACRTAVPVIKYIARRMVEAELARLGQTL